MNKSYKKHIAWSFLIVGWFVLGIFFDEILFTAYFGVGKYFKNQNKTEKNLVYINPDKNQEWIVTKYVPFELKTSKRIFEEVEKVHPDVSLDVYVRNLNNWPWFGIHEDEKFARIWTLKMPLFLAYLKWSEQEHSAVLEKKYTVEDKWWKNEWAYASKNTLENGKEYTVSQLLKEMIVNSNETAAQILRENIPESYLDRVYAELGLTIEGGRTEQDDISLKEYSSFFRILYNAAYLSPKTSEFALSLLTQTDFKEGIIKWVPKGVQVANKFWERIYIDETGKKSYKIHDCWVVYYEQYPYMICIASEWKDEKTLANTIGETSRIVYEEISKAYPEKK